MADTSSPFFFPTYPPPIFPGGCYPGFFPAPSPPPAFPPSPPSTSYPCSYPPSAAAYHSAPPILEPPNTGAPANSVLPVHDSSWSPALHTPNRDFYPSSSAAYTPDHLPDQAAPQIDAYQNPFFPGGYYPPPPYLAGYCSAPPTFPNPHPPPAVPPIHGYSHFPITHTPSSPVCYSFPSAPHWPPPAPELPPALGSTPPQPPRAYHYPRTESSTPTTPVFACATAVVDLSFNRVDTKPSHHSRVCNMATNRAQQVSKDMMPCQAGEQALVEATISEHMSQSQSSFDSLQAELSKLRYRLSSLATSMVPSSSSSTSTTERITSVPAMSASSVPAAPAYVAPQVFAEMATPTSEQETQGTTSNFCSGQLNPIQMSCVSNLNEQNLDEMPQPYGFHNLDRHSVFLADGTEHSYYALPESYPCEQAILAPVFHVYDDESNGRSNEFVQVFAGTPEQQTNSVEKQASHQAPDCFSKPTFCPERPTVVVFNLGNELNPDNEPTAVCVSKAAEIGQTSACLSYNSEILDCTLEQQHQVNEKASVNAQQLRAPPWNVLVIDETRTEWHPGDHTIRLLFYSQGYVVAKRETVQWDPGIGTHSSMYFWLPGLTARIATRKPLSWLQNSELATWQSLMTSASSVWDPGVHIYLYSWLNILLVWAAADKQLSCTHISDLASWRNHLVCNAASSIWDPGIDSLMLVYICLHLRMTQLGGSSATHACYLPSALLPHIHIVSYGSSNSKAGELTFRCLVFHLQQSNNRTSTISHGIASYAYTMKFINDQLELVHQQGVQKNYNAKSLISSQNYLQLSEWDIIFTTFLPP